MTFDKMSVWPIGYFKTCTSWLLNNRRDVFKRIAVINAEVRRIGDVKVVYRKYKQGDNLLASEERIGISVTHGSSVGKLMQAYIAQGGNPLDISPFMHPSGTVVEVDAEDGSMVVEETYPSGGVVAPISTENIEQLPDIESNELYLKGGYLCTDRYYAPRQGVRMMDRSRTDSDIIVKTMHQIRAWANQDIKERLQEIEWRIIKLCDLREQLLKERDEILVQAWGGGSTIPSPGELDPEKFNPDLQVQVLIQGINEIIFETDEIGGVLSYGLPNSSIAYLGFTFEDTPSEATRDAMGC